MIILLAIFGSLIVAAVIAISRKIERMRWAKTLVDWKIPRLQQELSKVKKKRDVLMYGFLGMSKGQQNTVMYQTGDLDARIKILENLIEQRIQKKIDLDSPAN